MRIPDVDVLVNAVRRDSPQHDLANRWLTEVLQGGYGIGFAWQAVLGFVRITSNHRLFGAALRPQQALAIIEGWLASPSSELLNPSSQQLPLLTKLLAGDNDRHWLVMDAHLAALAIEHKATLTTFDRDYLRFDGLRVELLR